MKPTDSLELVLEAVDLAHDSHRGQWRKCSGSPYIVHPLEVAKRLGTWGVTKEAFPETQCAAILHDVIEDTTTTYNDIAELIGKNVANIVQELTFDNSTTKRDYLISFRSKSVQALVIKISDRLCNVEDYQIEQPDYAQEYWDKASVLFRIMHERKKEIEDFFGVAVFDEMRLDTIQVSLKLRG